ncbi:hypothetical protein BAUCODRAFT_41517, partial [Baudoinia panamericana UAMH 10762]
NPGNFANRPTEEVKAIASMGGKASHGGHNKEHEEEVGLLSPRPSIAYTDVPQRKDSVALEGRNPDGTFVKGSSAAKEAGHLGG